MAGAVVIPFPQAMRRDSGQERLRQALEELQAALAEQKRALSDWRFAMTELGIGVAGLGQALDGYHHSLGGVETRLTGLREAAGVLKNWIITVLPHTAGSRPTASVSPAGG